MLRRPHPHEGSSLLSGGRSKPSTNPNNQIDSANDVDTDSDESTVAAVQSIYIHSLTSNQITDTMEVGMLRELSWKERISVEEEGVVFKLDTGAEINVLPLSTYRKLKNKPSMTQTKTTNQPYGEDSKILDLKDAFWHIKLDNKSSELCTFNTPLGRYKFNRLPFGISSAPEVFQKACHKIFSEIEGCEVYFDNLIIAGRTEKEHGEILNKVIDQARRCGLKFTKNKIQYKATEVKYVGHKISKEGTKPDPSHIQAILEMPKPENKADLMRLLEKFGSVYGQEGHPISYASRSLTETDNETRYAEIEKELLAVIFGVTKYHQYTYGRLVKIETDHKPLEAIFQKDITKVSARLQRMAYLKTHTEDDPELSYIVHTPTNNIPMTNAKKKEIFEAATNKDRTLKTLKQLVYRGWPKHKYQLPDEDLVPDTLQQPMLNLIHEGHLGIEKCKLRARDIMYWRGMTGDTESTIELIELNNKTASEVVLKLKTIFARLGVSNTVISDNNPFLSFEFETFSKEWDFESVTTSPLHSQPTGLAEKSKNTPLKEIGSSPAQLMFDRKLRTKLPISDKLFLVLQILGSSKF
ncbi:uncharacterized protein K02A2.6-like [Diprion similis]|uniref:uncharacterized protein K02A2.6-like n=1 Tax=Diprion similis TaxID=362088 RepID=UPI001EF77E2D|nr:uncharacterized protein K02A2.6-like [Diprion similis]